MRIGICLHYQRTEVTYAALRVADWLVQNGHTVSLLSVGCNGVKIGSKWDSSVLYSESVYFSLWANGYDLLLFTFLPGMDRLEFMAERKKLTSLLADITTLEVVDCGELREFNCILCPSRFVYKQLAAKQLHNMANVPLSVADVVYRKPSTAEKTISIFYPVWDRVGTRTECTAVEVLRRLLQRQRTIRVVVGITSSTLGRTGWLRLKALQLEYADRVTILKGIPADRRLELFMQHDFVYWPSCFESIGMVGLQALAAGTPLIAFNVPVVNEIVTEANGIVARCNSFRNFGIGAVVGDPDYVMLDNLLQLNVCNRGLINRLQCQTYEAAVVRRNEFHRNMSILFE